MELLISFILFIAAMIICLSAGITMILPLSIGFFLFSCCAVRKGFSAKDVLSFALESMKESFIVVRILLLIGCMTGMWRICGTVAYFVTLGISLIPPSVFLLAAFLLTAVMSFALGTSFGVTATAGVILISIARAGGIDPILTAGAILSGVYVGDRGSPAASSGNLVAVLTHTDMRKNVRVMLKTSVIPLIVCCAAYALLSGFTPMQAIDTQIAASLAKEFFFSPWCLAPAVVMIVLPFCGVAIRSSMLVSLALSALVTLFVQHKRIINCLSALILGFTPDNPALSQMLSGGGIISMLEVCVILMISGTYGGIFRRTQLLDGLTSRLKQISCKIGRYPLMLLMSVFISGMFCNQTIGIIMQNQLSAGLYGDTPEECTRKMLDIENSVVLIAGLIPWCIACSVPLAMLDVDARAVPFGLYLWLVPVCYFIQERKHNFRQT